MRAIRFALLVTVAGCAIPDRDNRFDSGHAPKARLSVVDVTADDGSCAMPPTSEQAIEVIRASRGRCLALDASRTVDPQDDALTFEYALISPTAICDDLPCSFEGASLELIPEELRRHPLALDTAGLLFEVRTEDEHGYIDFAEARVTLTNAPPRVIAGSARALPVGGYPWAFGAPFDVVFDPLEASDPDGDAIEYCWRLPQADGYEGPEICSPDRDDPQFTASIPSGEVGFFRAKVRVRERDNAASSSDVDTTLVTVGNPSLWTYPEDIFEQEPVSERIDGMRRPVAAVGSTGAFFQFGTFIAGNATEPPSVAILREGPEVVRINWFEGDQVLEKTLLFGSPAAIRAGAEATRLWAVVSCAEGQPTCPAAAGHRAWAFPLAVPGLTDEGLGPVELSFDPVSGAERNVLLSVDADGNAWVSRALDSSLDYVTAQGVVTTFDAGSGKVFADHGARPTTNEVWTLVIPDSLGTGPVAAIRVFRDGVPESEIVLDVPLAYGVAWVDRSRFWTYVPGEGAYLLDAELLAGGGTLEDAALALAPRIFGPTLDGGPDLVADPISGACWARGAEASVAVLLLESGEYLEFESDPQFRFEPLFVDDWGALWSVEDSQLIVGEAAGPGGVARVVRIAGGRIGPDLTSGGAWIPVIAPGALAFVARDGRLVHYLQRVLDGTVEKQIAEPFLTAFSPDGSGTWVLSLGFGTFELEGFDYFDLAGEADGVVPMVRLFDATEVGSVLGGIDEGLFEASAPVPGQAPFLWTIVNQGGPTVARIGLDASVTPVFAVPEGSPVGGRSLRNNDVCLVTSPADDSYRLRWITPEGAVGGPVDFAGPADSEVLQVSVASTPADDFCWVVLPSALTDSTRLLAFDRAGTGVHDVTLDYEVDSFHPVSDTEWWTTAGDENGNEVRYLGRWNGSSFTEQEFRFVRDNRLAPYSGGRAF